MSELFLNILTMSLSAAWLVPVVLLLRLALKRSPKWIHVLLWALVAFRLVCPLTFESSLSLTPDTGAALEEWTDDYVGDTHFIHDVSPGYQAAVDAGRPPISAGEDGYYVVTGPDGISEPDTVKNTVLPTLSVLWLAGMAVMALYTLISYLSLRRKMATAVRVKKNIYRSEAAASPFVLGLFLPRIYLPLNMAEADVPHVIAHENAHIRRKDHWWKPLGFAVLTVHWFNPLVWLSYILLCRDIELACDEKVIRELGQEEKAEYSQALLNCSIRHRSIAACPLAFGEVGVKQRVKSILHYKKPGFWILLVALLLCLAVAVFFLTDPVTEEPEPEFHPTIQWFDYLETGTYPDSSADFQAKTPDFPDVTFQCTPGELTAETPSGSTTLITGMPIWNLYLCDLTGDGIDEFCASVSFGSGIIDQHVVVYDYATQTEYTLWERGVFDYTLRLEDGVLMCDKRFYPHEDIADTGPLMLVSAGGGDGKRLAIRAEEEKQDENSVSFESFDFSNVDAVLLTNAHNGKPTAIADPDAIKDICALLSVISGDNGRNSKGWHYQGTFALTLMAGDEQVLQIAFGDDDVFFYGKYDRNYAMMYDLVDYNIESVIHYLYRYDESGYDWGYEETWVTAETTPYSMTQSIPQDGLQGDIEYLQPGDILSYGFLKEERQDLAILLNNLTEDAFVEPEDFTATMKVNLRWDGGKLILYSDGNQTVFGDDQTWAVRNGDLNKFLSRFTQERLAGGQQLPLEELNPYYNSEQAMIDGCVVMHDHDIRDNAQVFFDFYDAVTAGSPATVRIAEFASEERFAVQVADILFDGESYTWQAVADGQLYERRYQHLYHFSGEPEAPNASYDAYDAYVLTDAENVTWEQLWASLYSSQAGAAIDFTLVYMDYIYYPDHPVIPDCGKITLEFEGELLLTVQDTDALEALLSRAELTYEPKTWLPGPILRMVGTDGTEVVIELGLDTDWIRIDGIYYDFGPGFDEDGAYDALSELFSLLGIEDWPQEVKDAYPDFF